ncbi:glycosyltransferase [Silvibacterium sp.]|uniref:glycosyltransferase n=1 Tax=Silvibacterium sp. TaxID=1964179 RepID=UPI0039E390DE
MNTTIESQEPFVSVVMPCYNSRRTIGDCLASVEAQSYPRGQFEILVADNGSTDGSQEWISKHFPLVRLVTASAKGSGNARNSGFAAARSRWIISIDSDCVAAPQWIASLVRAMQGAPEKTAAIGGYIRPYRLQTLVERYPPAWVAQPEINNPNIKVRYTATPNAIFDRTAVEEVGGFDASAGHDDTDLGLRLTSAGYSCAYEPDAVVAHRNPVTLLELYEHRYKYGERNFILAQKHRSIFGDPQGAAKRKQLLKETLSRIAKDVVKLPLSVAYRPKGSPIGWPLVDAVMAWGNYQGYAHISLKSEGQV